jgi:hypothetical protein
MSAASGLTSLEGGMVVVVDVDVVVSTGTAGAGLARGELVRCGAATVVGVGCDEDVVLSGMLASRRVTSRLR